MRAFTFSSLALLASTLLAKEAFAGPIAKRAVVTDNVIITEEIIVTAYPGGVLRTGRPKRIGTKTIYGSVVVTTVKPAATVTSTTTKKVIPSSTTTASPSPASSSSSPAAPAVFKEQEKSTTTSAAPAPVTTSQAPVATPTPAPTTSSPAPVAPSPTTTLAQVVSSAAAPVASAVSSAVSSGGSGKRGVAFNNAGYLSAFTGNSQVSWCYNWGASNSDTPSGLEFVPLLWGLGSHADNWESNANQAISSGAKHLLAFNEPDLGEQANLDVGTAVSGYKQHMQPFAGKAKLGSPAVTNGGSPMGLTWLGNFISSCTGCTIDFVAVHWYNGGDAAAFKDYIGNKVKAVAGGRPIWITEFQAPGSQAEQLAFLAEVLPWLDSQSYVERYALFMASDGLMMSGNGLSAIGKAFVA